MHATAFCVGNNSFISRLYHCLRWTEMSTLVDFVMFGTDPPGAVSWVVTQNSIFPLSAVMGVQLSTLTLVNVLSEFVVVLSEIRNVRPDTPCERS